MMPSITITTWNSISKQMNIIKLSDVLYLTCVLGTQSVKILKCKI
jgi:hypothetical protein